MQYKDKKQKPTKDPFIKFYIVWPIQNCLEDIAYFFKRVWRRIIGAWWCDYCETYHGRRVNRFYMPSDYAEYVCSLGRAAKADWQNSGSPLQDILSTKAKIDAKYTQQKI